jgi:hypothetical protein
MRGGVDAAIDTLRAPAPHRVAVTA